MLAHLTVEEQVALEVVEARRIGQAKAEIYWLRLVNEGWGHASRLQAEYQADHHDKIADHEIRIGQRIP